MRLRFNLQTRYSFQILGVIIITVVGLSAISYRELQNVSGHVQRVTSQSFKEHLEGQVVERGRVMSEYLANDLATPLVRHDMLSMLELLRTTTEQQDVKFAYVYDANGSIIHDGSVEISRFGENIDAILDWPVSRQVKQSSRFAGNVLQVARPVWLGSERLGGIAVGLSLGPVQTEISELSNSLRQVTADSLRSEGRITLVVTLLFIVTGILFSMAAGRRLAKPISDLAQMALRVGNGQFANDFKIARNDEVGDLAKAFNTMNENLRRSDSEVQILAYHDPLTGLPNRARLRESMDELCIRCREGDSRGAVLFIDLDDFKPVNDTLGHEAGDALLRNAAERLLDCLRTEPGRSLRFANEEDRSVARLGGDEFTIILEGLGEREDAAQVAEHALAELCRPFQLQGHEVTIGASIGIATYPEDGRDGASLLSHADVAMYAAKSKGKQAYCFYEETMYEKTRDRLFLMNELRHALETDGFDVHYQPIIGGHSGRAVGVEALVRWHHPDRGLINAAEFIEVAEKSGEIERLGRYVLEQVCSDLSDWRRRGIEGLVASINLSSPQLLRPDLPDLLTGLLASHDLTPRDLRIEASENRILSQLGAGTSILHELSRAGFEIWVDRFGSGPASLLNLRRTPARGIKLGHDFIGDIETSERSRQYVKALIRMARSVDLEVCAVGVGSEAQASWLRGQGCRYLQGRFLGPELQGAALPDYLEFQRRGNPKLAGNERLRAS